MPTSGWVVVGVLGGLASLRVARLVAADIQRSTAAAGVGWVAWLGAGLLGAATAVIGSTAAISGAVVLAIVAIFFVVQTPSDLLAHRLSRPVTLAATVAIAGVVAADALASASLRPVIEVFGWASVVAAVYALLHRVSPQSLGWGDVLLIVPLSVAVAFVDADRLVVWQLLAATSGAAHAVARRARRGSTVIPFGPHLLGSAWVVLATSV
jgi:leader peptidase (prepilin peptidase)/N-methyltransferase